MDATVLDFSSRYMGAVCSCCHEDARAGEWERDEDGEPVCHKCGGQRALLDNRHERVAGG